tara:strand:+ start:847 stop:1098 length:252 start_codon:yes stop_codon:yes gene_type:complete
MEFQIKQSYSDGCGGWIYFTAKGTETIDKLKKMAIDAMNEDWGKVNPALYFSAPKPARPTIEVAEYAEGKKVKNGIKFKCKWR